MAVLVDVLLGLAVLVVFASSLGILLMRDVYQKLHFVTPAAIVAPLFVGIAVLIESGWSTRSAQTWLALLFVIIASPVLSHATIRAARIRATGDWRGPEGGTEPEQRKQP
jgi:monovalent cation/proton antiporter MnhG/PhaG subunit